MKTRWPLQVAVFAQVNDVLDVALAVVVARVRLAGEDELDRAGPCRASGARCSPTAGRSAARACRWQSGAQSRWSARPDSSNWSNAMKSPCVRRWPLDQQAAARRIRSVRGAACKRSAQISSSEMKSGSAMRCQNSGELSCAVPIRSCRGRPVAGRRRIGAACGARTRRTVPFIQPSRWMPLVMWPMGTCSTGLSGIEAVPHVPADAAVQFAHGVGGARELQRQHGHAERLLQVLRIHPAQRHQLRERRRRFASRKRCSA